MFHKINVLKIFRNLKTYRAKSLKKTVIELFLAKVQAFHLYVFVKINKYTGRFQDSIFLKKTLF